MAINELAAIDASAGQGASAELVLRVTPRAFNAICSAVPDFFSVRAAFATFRQS